MHCLGVLMETRGMGGSRRLNVRGSALRSPFAVRNTMLFVRGFLLTEADGTSPVNGSTLLGLEAWNSFRARQPPRLAGPTEAPWWFTARPILLWAAFKR